MPFPVLHSKYLKASFTPLNRTPKACFSLSLDHTAPFYNNSLDTVGNQSLGGVLAKTTSGRLGDKGLGTHALHFHALPEQAGRKARDSVGVLGGSSKTENKCIVK